jgi:hypothetical protein
MPIRYFHNLMIRLPSQTSSNHIDIGKLTNLINVLYLFQWVYTDCCFSDLVLTVVSVSLHWLLFQWSSTDCCFSDLALWKSNLAFNNNQSLINHWNNSQCKLTEATVSVSSLKQESVQDHWNNSQCKLTETTVSVSSLKQQSADTDCYFSDLALTVVSVILHWLLFQWAYTDCCFRQSVQDHWNNSQCKLTEARVSVRSLKQQSV